MMSLSGAVFSKMKGRLDEEVAREQGKGREKTFDRNEGTVCIRIQFKGVLLLSGVQ